MIAQIDPKTKKARYFDIRKLTPRECGRLMGVPEDALNRMIEGTEEDEMKSGDNKHVSVYRRLTNSSLYKLFGNSIVVDVLAAIYRRLWYADFDDATDPNAPLPLFEEAPWTLTVPNGGIPLRVVTLCSGYDAQCLALDVLADWSRREGHTRLNWDLVAWSEFDPESKTPLERQPAVVAHNLIFPQYADRNVGDMTKADWAEVLAHYNETAQITPPITEIDLLTYSTPCTDISQAGKRAGIAPGSGTRSAILWHTEEAVKALRPKILLQENVAALVNQQNIGWFREWQRTLSRLGYDNYWQVLNARDIAFWDDLGPVPQNRDRIFQISVRKDLHQPPFVFPRATSLQRTIADILEDDAPESFFLKPESVCAFLKKNEQEPMVYHVTDHKLSKEEIRQIIIDYDNNNI